MQPFFSSLNTFISRWKEFCIMKSTFSHNISSKSTPILSSHLRIQSDLAPANFSTKVIYAFIISSMRVIVCLFLCSLLKTRSVTQTAWRQMIGWWRTINWNGCGRKRSCPSLRHCLRIFLKRLKKTTNETSFRIVGHPTEVRTGYLPNASYKCYRIRQLSLC
jgi:hypothetical protein